LHQVFTVWACVQECMDSCCFVLQLVGVCTASENGDECGIKLEIILLMWLLFASVCRLPNFLSYSKRFEPCPSLGTTSVIRSLPGFDWIRQCFFTTLPVAHTLQFETQFQETTTTIPPSALIILTGSPLTCLLVHVIQYLCNCLR
jgi:hypothetical protein